MASSTSETLQNIKVHKVPNFDVWEDQYGQTNGIGTDDIVVIPPAQLDNHMRTLVPAPGTSNPAMDGTASPGASSTKTFSKSDHVHPTDTSRAPTNHASTETTYGVGNGSNYGHLKLSDSTSSTNGTSNGTAATPSAVKAAYDLANGKQSKITANGILKGDGNGGVTAAVAGTDYLAPGSGGDLVYEETTTEQVMTFGEDWVDYTNGATIIVDSGPSSGSYSDTFYSPKAARGVVDGEEGIGLVTRSNGEFAFFWTTDNGITWERKQIKYGQYNSVLNYTTGYSVWFLKYINGIWILGIRRESSDYHGASWIYVTNDLIHWDSRTGDISYSSYSYGCIRNICYLNGYYYVQVAMSYNYDPYHAYYSAPAANFEPGGTMTGADYNGWTQKRSPFSGGYGSAFFTYGDYLFFEGTSTTNSSELYYFHKDATTFADSSKKLQFSAQFTMSDIGAKDNNLTVVNGTPNKYYFFCNNAMFSFDESSSSFTNPIVTTYGQYNNNSVNCLTTAVVNNALYGTAVISSKYSVVKYSSFPNITTSPIIVKNLTASYNYYHSMILIYLSNNNSLSVIDSPPGNSGVYCLDYTINKTLNITELQDSNSNSLTLSMSNLIQDLPIGYINSGHYFGNGRAGFSSINFNFFPKIVLVYLSYTAVSSAPSNPKTSGLYEYSNGSMVLTNDTSAQSGKTYYSVPSPNGLAPNGSVTISGNYVSSLTATLAPYWNYSFLWTPDVKNLAVSGALVTFQDYGKTLAWTSTNVGCQLNTSGNYYSYIAIGTKS